MREGGRGGGCGGNRDVVAIGGEGGVKGGPIILILLETNSV